MKSHNNHKILLIDDEESLKKENLTFDFATKDFENKYEKMNHLKEKIEQEVININNSYENVFNDISKSFELKHEQLYKEEKDLIENLQNEVTKIKEKLENFLSESNNIIRICDKINKGISKLEKNNNHYIIQNISYVSKINKIQKEIDDLNYESMINIKINFDEKNANVNYEKYVFNGIPIPSNILIDEITNSSFKANWKIEQNNEFKDKIKFRLEIKKENENFNKIYEGNQNSYSINGLLSNTSYEIRICSFYDNYNSPWGEIIKIKTKAMLNRKALGNLFG